MNGDDIWSKVLADISKERITTAIEGEYEEVVSKKLYEDEVGYLHSQVEALLAEKVGDLQTIRDLKLSMLEAKGRERLLEVKVFDQGLFIAFLVPSLLLSLLMLFVTLWLLL